MRIAIVEDEGLYADILAKICRQELNAEVVLNTGDGSSAAAAIIALKPDLAILDLGLPGADGFTVAEQIRSQVPRTRILIVSCRCDPVTLLRLDTIPVDGFIDKQQRLVSDLSFAIREVGRGGQYFSPYVAKIRLAMARDPTAFYHALTPAELKTLPLFGASLNDEEIAAKLGISPGTVKRRRQDTKQKLGVHTTHDMIRVIRMNGVRPPEDLEGPVGN